MGVDGTKPPLLYFHKSFRASLAKKFREYNLLKFIQQFITESVDFTNFSTEFETAKILPQCGNHGILLPPLFRKNSVKSTLC